MVLFLTDQHRVDSVGCYGNRLDTSPNIDSIAREGVRFTNAFTPTSICSPARASLITGVTPLRHGLLTNYEVVTGMYQQLRSDVPTIGPVLGSQGYRTAVVGKWHVSRHRGFAALGFPDYRPHYPGWHNPVQHPRYRDYLRARNLPEFSVGKRYRTIFPNMRGGHDIAGILRQPARATFEHFLADEAIDIVRGWAPSNSEHPFFLSAHFFGPHLPYYLPEEAFCRFDAAAVELPSSMFEETFDRKPQVQRHYSAVWRTRYDEATWRRIIAAYWGYVHLIDAQIGRVLQAIDDVCMARPTVVLFAADHGEFTGSHRLNDKGPAMYDETYRVPLVMRLPGPGRGRTEDRFASLLDIPATILDLAGAPRSPTNDSNLRL